MNCGLHIALYPQCCFVHLEWQQLTVGHIDGSSTPSLDKHTCFGVFLCQISCMPRPKATEEHIISALAAAPYENNGNFFVIKFGGYYPLRACRGHIFLKHSYGLCKYVHNISRSFAARKKNMGAKNCWPKSQLKCTCNTHLMQKLPHNRRLAYIHHKRATVCIWKGLLH